LVKGGPEVPEGPSAWMPVRPTHPEAVRRTWSGLPRTRRSFRTSWPAHPGATRRSKVSW